VDGLDGDYYLDLDSGDLYQKNDGAWDEPIGNLKGGDGDTGAAGADGTIWRSGSGAPDDSTGVDGDYWLDTDTGALRGPPGRPGLPARLAQPGRTPR
jgi:hypothetical protein